MATIKELIEYLQKFDSEADVRVLRSCKEYGEVYTYWVDLQIPEKGGYSNTIVYGHFRNEICIGENNG